ncbi:MAG: phytanoyl-CoA dioxygenase, partial [Chloroflexi bacterium]|nr:phytanoyl-CoA dioxygenase [Chloroflexota bacterium]
PPRDEWPRFAERGVRKYPQMGDLSCRSALTIHRGTAHGSPIARPVLVLGVDTRRAEHSDKHDLVVTRGYFDALPDSLRAHLRCRVADTLEPLAQKHDIEGLVMGVE